MALKKVVAAGILLCLQSFRPRRASRDGHCRYPRQCVYLVPSVGCWAAHGAALWGSTYILVLVTSSKIFYGYLLEIVPFLPGVPHLVQSSHKYAQQHPEGQSGGRSYSCAGRCLLLHNLRTKDIDRDRLCGFIWPPLACRMYQKNR